MSPLLNARGDVPHPGSSGPAGSDPSFSGENPDLVGPPPPLERLLPSLHMQLLSPSPGGASWAALGSGSKQARAGPGQGPWSRGLGPDSSVGPGGTGSLSKGQMGAGIQVLQVSEQGGPAQGWLCGVRRPPAECVPKGLGARSLVPGVVMLGGEESGSVQVIRALGCCPLGVTQVLPTSDFLSY